MGRGKYLNSNQWKESHKKDGEFQAEKIQQPERKDRINVKSCYWIKEDRPINFHGIK